VLFASGFGESFFWMLMFIGIGLWAMGRLLKKNDPEGKVKGAAVNGLVSLISRWLK
jgi:hypothetical protein